MYLSDGEKDIIIDHLVELLHEEEILVAFARRLSELYDDYDEGTADEIVIEVKHRFIEKHCGG